MSKFFLISFKFLSRLGIAGISLYPFVLVSSQSRKSDNRLINHERIHLRQQLELLILPFYIWYVVEYLVLRLTRSHDQAYRNIIFEREAYLKEDDLNYLKSRRLWQFISFYRQKETMNLFHEGDSTVDPYDTFEDLQISIDIKRRIIL